MGAGSRQRPAALAGPTLTRTISPVSWSLRNTSPTPFVSPGTRLVALDAKTRYRPSFESTGFCVSASACTETLLTRVVTPLESSRTNTSPTPLVSPATRSAASDVKATVAPLSVIGAPFVELPFAAKPPVSTLMQIVAPVSRSCRSV